MSVYNQLLIRLPDSLSPQRFEVTTTGPSPVEADISPPQVIVSIGSAVVEAVVSEDE